MTTQHESLPELALCPFCGSDARTVDNTDDIPTWAQCKNHGNKKKGDKRCVMSHAIVPIADWNVRAAIAAQGGQKVVSPEVVAWLNTSYGGIHRNCKEILESAAYENGELVPLGRIVEAQTETDDATLRAINEVAHEHAHVLALNLECILYEYSGQWYDRAIDAMGKYRTAMCEIHERESPTHMGEPLIRKGVPK